MELITDFFYQIWNNLSGSYLPTICARGVQLQSYFNFTENILIQTVVIDEFIIKNDSSKVALNTQQIFG